MPTFWMCAGLGIAYVLGSIPTGYCVAKVCRGIDIRDVGSCNIGASNVGRVMGRAWGALVLIFDILKGTLAVLAGQEIFYVAVPWVSHDLYSILCAASVVAGHNWTIFLKFKGGKGVATSAGALLGISPLMLVLSAAVWAVAAKLFGYISIASMAAAASFCVWTFVFKTSVEMKVFAMIMTAVLIAKHRGNIHRLLRGTEPKIGQSLGKGDPVSAVPGVEEPQKRIRGLP